MGKRKNKKGNKNKYYEPPKPRGEKRFTLENGLKENEKNSNQSSTQNETPQAQPVQRSVNNDGYFINPYSFVPIEKEKPDRKAVERGSRTGVIECTLEIQPGHPLFIPNTSKRWKDPKNEKHYKYDFYSYDDLSGLDDKKLPTDPPKNPVIPGSEIRGMVRNVYEQLTNSCFLVTDEKNLPYKRTPKPKKAGLLDKENNVLYEATRYMLNDYGNSDFGTRITSSDFHTGDLIYFRPTTETYGEVSGKSSIKTKGVSVPIKADGSKPSGYFEGYVLIGEAFGRRKHHDSVMVKGNEVGNVTGDIERFMSVLELYEGYSDYKKSYKDRSKQFVPVFYEKVGDVTYMSPAQITKEVFNNTVNKLLDTDQNSHHQSCSDKNNACPACRLFGMISKNTNNGAIKGRVRFADAKTKEAIEAHHFEWYTLPILGTPHLSATEFYLKRPEELGEYGMWNYDYYTSFIQKYRNGNPELDPKGKPKLILKDTIPSIPTLAGRKVYWHGKFNTSEFNTKMNQTVRALKSGKFTFSVYYEDLSDEELSDLKFSLDLNGEGVHKIGRGKPIGMGDVKLSITGIKERTYEMAGGKVKAMLSKDIKSEIDPTGKETKYILRYTDPTKLADLDLVAYPSANKSDSKIYEWFSKNRGSIQHPTIDQILPKIMRKDQRLKK